MKKREQITQMIGHLSFRHFEVLWNSTNTQTRDHVVTAVLNGVNSGTVRHVVMEEIRSTEDYIKDNHEEA